MSVEYCKKCRKRIADDHEEEVHNTGECGCDAAGALCWSPWGSCNGFYDNPADGDCFDPGRDDEDNMSDSQEKK